MSLSDMLTTATLIILVYAGAHWLNGAYIAPRLATKKAESVKASPRSLKFKKRSQRSKGSNAVNVGSEHKDAGSERSAVQSVQPVVALPAEPSTPGASSSDGFTLNPREMVQLGEALNLYRDGATIEQAVCQAFGVTKGGSEGWKRAKALFDAATVAPGAAPAGTYAATAPLKRARRRLPAR